MTTMSMSLNNSKSIVSDGSSNIVGRRPSTNKKRTNSRLASMRSARSEQTLQSSPTTTTTQQLTDDQLYQIQLMYSGRSSSRLAVCSCLANVYRSSSNCNWQLTATGVPLLLLNADSTSLLLVVAEKGTAFALWTVELNRSTCKYSEISANFHTFYCAVDENANNNLDGRYMAGLSFDSVYAAMRFYQNVEQMLKYIDNGRLFTTIKHHQRSPAIRKTQISHPCCFNHVTSLKAADISPSTNSSSSKRSQSCYEIYTNSTMIHTV